MKLISLNIETDKHLALVEQFLKKESPDIVCLQEVHESDFQEMKQKFNMHGAFAPMGQRVSGKTNEMVRLGVAIFSTVPIEHVQRAYYFGNEETVDDVLQPAPQDYYAVLLSCQTNGCTIGTTHFTWSNHGEATDRQRKNVQKLLEALETFDDIIFCGDFNAPRGREIFDTIASKYSDNIPKRYTTSIDGDLHRAGQLNLMVDGLFATPRYKTKNVKLIPGISDHMAIVADISHPN